MARDALRNAVIVGMAIGGSTNLVLHAPEIARAAGYVDFWTEIMTPEEFNHLSQHVVPVLTDARPYGKYSMIDIDRVGGVQVIVRELLEAGLLNGDVMTCTGETLAAQVERLGAKRADGKVIYPAGKPYKPTGGLRMLGGNLSPDYSAILKLAGVEGGLEENIFRGRARVFEGERSLLDALDRAPERFQNHDMIVVRYEGPSGAPGMPEMLDPTSRITALCRERRIVVGGLHPNREVLGAREAKGRALGFCPAKQASLRRAALYPAGPRWRAHPPHRSRWQQLYRRGHRALPNPAGPQPRRRCPHSGVEGSLVDHCQAPIVTHCRRGWRVRGVSGLFGQCMAYGQMDL